MLLALRDMVWKSFGWTGWEEVLEQAGLIKHCPFLASADIEDVIVMKIFDAVCEVLQLQRGQVAEMYTDFWIGTYTPRIFPTYYHRARNAREFLLNLNETHRDMAKIISGSRPPRFEYQWKDGRTLIMTYHSHREMIDFFAAFAKGVGRWYNEDMETRPMGNGSIEIEFSPCSAKECTRES